jgi:hypothetical protein
MMLTLLSILDKQNKHFHQMGEEEVEMQLEEVEMQLEEVEMQLEVEDYLGRTDLQQLSIQRQHSKNTV